MYFPSFVHSGRRLAVASKELKDLRATQRHRYKSFNVLSSHWQIAERSL